MSNDPQESTGDPPQAESQAAGKNRKGFLIVIGIIAIVAGAYCYDTFVVPRTVQAAFTKVADARLKAAVDEVPLTNMDVRGVLGKEPGQTYEKEGRHYEVFHWTGGMLINSHKLYAVYRKEGEDMILDHHGLHAEDSEDVELVVVEYDPNAVDEGDDEQYPSEEMEGGGYGSGGPGPGGSSGDADSSSGRPPLESDQGSAATPEPSASSDAPAADSGPDTSESAGSDEPE